MIHTFKIVNARSANLAYNGMMIAPTQNVKLQRRMKVCVCANECAYLT